MFRGKTQEQANIIIKKISFENRDDWFEMGYEYGTAYKLAGFTINDRTPLWSEILEMDFIEGFNKGYKVTEALDIISENLKENIPDCHGIIYDNPHTIFSFDNERNKVRKIYFEIKLNSGVIISLSIESIDREIQYVMVWPNKLSDCLDLPLVELNNHMESKREIFGDMFVQLNPRGYPLDGLNGHSISDI